MTAHEFLVEISQVFFTGLIVVTALDFIQHKDRVRRDIFLMFFCLAASNFISLVRAMTSLELAWITPFTQVLLIAQPFLLLRIVRYFQAVPQWVNQAALLGMIASWLCIVFISNPLPRLITLAVVAYFVFVNGYAMTAFTRGAFNSVGVVRQRLRLVAIGSGLLSVALFLIGVAVLIPSSAAAVSSIIQIVAIFCSIAYYLGFAPPRWLRQTWQLVELRNFLLFVQKSNSRGIGEIAEGLCLSVSKAMTMDKVIVVLWDLEANELVIRRSPGVEPVLEFDFQKHTLFQQIWRDQTPMIIYKPDQVDQEIIQLMTRFNTETLMASPISRSNRVDGLLMVFFEYGSLFPDDDLRLLSIFAQQTGILLENYAMLETHYQQTEDLEQKVQERTNALQRSNEELQLFAYITSHDLQEPLRMISSYLQLIEKRYANVLDDDGREFIEFAVDGASRMKVLIGDVLVYSRLGTQENQFVLLDMKTVLDEAVKLLSMVIEETHAQITHDPLPHIMGDHQLMVQLFQNLLSNAIKYCGEKTPKIHIGARRDGDVWTFCLQDNGIGIEQQYLEKIFVIFQRLHDRGSYPGTGIGLAVCKKVVELHGGRIWAESEVGVGTKFYFTIPTR